MHKRVGVVVSHASAVVVLTASIVLGMVQPVFADPPPKVTLNPSVVTLAEGGNQDITLTLPEPIIAPNPGDGYVWIEFTSDDTSRLTTLPYIYISENQWSQPQTLNISAIDDHLVNGNQAITLSYHVYSNSEFYSDFTGSIQVTVTDNDITPRVTNPSDQQVVPAGSLTITGVATANEQLAITVDDGEVGTATSDDSGNWSFLLQHVTAGTHNVKANIVTNHHYAFLANNYSQSIDVIDVDNHSYFHEITNANSRGVTYNTHNNKVYSASDNDGRCQMVVYDPVSFAQTAVISPDADCYTYGLAINHDGTKALMSFYDNTYAIHMMLVNLSDNSIINQQSLGSLDGTNPSGLSFSPDDTHFWVRTQSTIEEFDVAQLNPQRSIDLSPLSGGYQQNIVFASDGIHGYTTDQGGKVIVFNINDLSFETIDVGESAKVGALSPDGSKLFVVSAYPTSAIYVVDTDTKMVIDTFPVAQNLPPESIAITDDGQWVAGDDHGSGAIFFGTVANNAAVSHTIYAPDGGSYYTSTGGFVSTRLKRVLGTSTTLSFRAEAYSVPNSGFSR